MFYFYSNPAKISRRSLGGVEKGIKPLSKKTIKFSNKRESESDVFLLLENKKESVEDGKKRAIQISLTNWNKLVEIQLLAQEKENLIRKNKLEGKITSSNNLQNGGKAPGVSGGRNKNGRRGYDSGSDGGGGGGGRGRTGSRGVSRGGSRGGSGGESVEGERRRDRGQGQGRERYYEHPSTRATTAEYPPLL